GRRGTGEAREYALNDVVVVKAPLEHRLEVGAKAAPIGGQVLIANADQAPDRAPLGVELLHLAAVETAPEAPVSGDDRLDERRVHPGPGLRLECAVAAPVGGGASDLRMDLSQAAPGGGGRFGSAVNHDVCVVQRPQQAPPGVVGVVRMLADSGGNRWMRDLEHKSVTSGGENADVTGVSPGGRVGCNDISVDQPHH